MESDNNMESDMESESSDLPSLSNLMSCKSKAQQYTCATQTDGKIIVNNSSQQESFNNILNYKIMFLIII